MLPLTLLNAAQGRPILVELKNGETFNGHLEKCDTYMNLTLHEVIRTMPDGDRFFRLPECYIRGNNIKYLRIQDEVLEQVGKQQAQQRETRGSRFRGRGQRGRGGYGNMNPSNRRGRGRGGHY
ncbi:Lsm2-8 complex subunit Lsm4 [Schizosaccharomyces osmophilus]|uniref:LSM complex subunit LSM4 n=3 Tax=Schizosaccharomyces TaxID=4895 RepID=S9W892_SCHCR|nr:U6 snRNP-associated protein Lsm4 [Schizosaccharomyces octosporus yFS286]XP_013020908.1 U6 snRNP-associated protein Lsm4 [Schizosaccharomyces cryophilus OY26]XP_056037233.1 Lsm2-8 complex subunit Lsm4 [Schizosaccharomyces osmophilus]EPX72444.1 U6 snRNP-associated protein Lsm4 [Schizosaccharomyces octosporus yFS286]EPY53985.1 U6 snRNP-associated protein Lsm4 [Schizosaccharomyces cryophilus OY26]WBW72990.1 Lsm2-8 complex subunit Lsm4 [Schizosaccharomyces osmophilus]